MLVPDRQHKPYVLDGICLFKVPECQNVINLGGRQEFRQPVQRIRSALPMALIFHSLRIFTVRFVLLDAFL